MNKSDFMAALRQALAGLPPEERQNAIQYYEDYFADAGEENEAQVLAELDSPEAIARTILSDYRELAAAPSEGFKKASQTPKGISPWLLLVILVLAATVGVPLLGALLSVLLAVLCTILIILAIIVLLPIVICIVGIGLCWAGAAALFVAPASGIFVIGGGLICLAIGLALTALVIKLLTKAIPPAVRGFADLCRRILERGKRS